MTGSGAQFVPNGAEPPIGTVLRDAFEGRRTRIWHRKRSAWCRDGDPRAYRYARLVRDARRGHTYTVLYEPPGERP